MSQANSQPVVRALLQPEATPTALDMVELLLQAARTHPESGQWLQIKAAADGAIDAARAEVAALAPSASILSATKVGTLKTVRTVARTFPGVHELALIVALARGLDDAYGQLFLRPWTERVSNGRPLQANDAIVVPSSEHLRRLFPDQPLAASQNRADERADQTLRVRLYEPSPTAPPIRFRDDLASSLDEVMFAVSTITTAHPTRSTADYKMEYPLRPVDESEHLLNCGALLEAAFVERTSIVVFPEFSGHRDVTDTLRAQQPSTPTLVVGGSSHLAHGPRKNQCLAWIARSSGNVPSEKPISVTKRIAYEGKLGREKLEKLGDEITIQVDGPWRLAIGICRDLLAVPTLDALLQAGVNLLLVPAWSPKTANFSSVANSLAKNAPGIAVVANGPRYFFNDETNTELAVPLGIYSGPVDNLIHPVVLSEGEPPVLSIFDLKSNGVTTQVVSI